MKFHHHFKKLFSDSFLRKALYIVAIIGIVIVTVKIVNGTITMRQYNYGSERSNFIKKIEDKYGF